MLLWRYEQSRKERLARCVYVSRCLRMCICVRARARVCVYLCVRERQLEGEREGREGIEGTKGGRRGQERRRLLLLSLFEQTRSFTSATRREPDIMPLMSAPADCTIDVTLENFLSSIHETAFSKIFDYKNDFLPLNRRSTKKHNCR